MESLTPDSYIQFLAEVKTRIQTAQVRASLAVNRELFPAAGRKSDSSSGPSAASADVGRAASGADLAPPSWSQCVGSA
jgi:hypothetical protein